MVNNKDRNDKRWRQYWLERACCSDFVDHILSDMIEFCEGWNMLDDDGRWLIVDFKHCPFCGAELTQDPYAEVKI